MKSVIELIDPTNINIIYNHFKLGGGWSYVLDYSWIYNNIVEYSKKNKITNILDVGCGKSRFGRYISNTLHTNVIGIDRRNLPNVLKVDNFLEFNPKTKFDVIFWASSLEHNDIERMIDLFEHSMEILKDKGLFLATIPISKLAGIRWNSVSSHTNLNITASKDIFRINTVIGEYKDIENKYLSNPFNIMDKYENRYGFRELEYIIGGIRKINE